MHDKGIDEARVQACGHCTCAVTFGKRILGLQASAVTEIGCCVLKVRPMPLSWESIHRRRSGPGWDALGFVSPLGQ